MHAASPKIRFRDAQIEMAHGAGGKASRRLIEGLFAPLLFGASVGTSRRRGAHRLERHAPRHHRRQLRGQPAELSRRLHRRTGGQRDRERSGRIGRARRSAGRHLCARSRPADRRPGSRSARHGPRPRAPPESRSWAATPRWSSTARPTACTSRRPASAGPFPESSCSARSARPGDNVLLSGPIGDHGITILLARGELDLEADLCSDTRSVLAVGGSAGRGGGARPALDARSHARRCGHLAERTRARLRAGRLSVRRPHSGARRGARRLRTAGPGPAAHRQRRSVPRGGRAGVCRCRARGAPADARAATERGIIGEVREQPAARCSSSTPYGGTRIVDMLVGDPLPRIC